MHYRPLGQTDLEVSAIGLGTMTFGNQNTEAEAHSQLDMAIDAGVNFLDTAEMYPFPAQARNQGDSERIIGSWVKRRGDRDKVIVASKVSGPGIGWLKWIRGGPAHLDRANIEAAIEASLERLQTDYIDLYQLHWPERHTNYFGRLGYEHRRRDDEVPIRETLEVLADLIEAGKVRHFGVSNETPWGAMTFCKLADEHGLPRVVSIQNPYNLLNRTFEIGGAEIAHREAVGLIAYSPLAFSVLSGKYLGGAQPEGARLTLYPQYKRYLTEAGESATRAYLELAQAHRVSLAQMSLAYVISRPFVTSTLITATNLEQLGEDLASIDAELSESLVEGIESIHDKRPNPCP